MRGIKIKLDKTRHLKMTLDSLAKLKEILGLNPYKPIPDTCDFFDKEHYNLEELAAVTWACLIHEDNDLTIKETKEILRNHCFEFSERAVLAEKIGEATAFLSKEAKKALRPKPVLRTLGRK